MNKYIMLRHHTGLTFAVNCKMVLRIAVPDRGINPAANTQYIGFRRCSLNEYITNKLEKVIENARSHD